MDSEAPGSIRRGNLPLPVWRGKWGAVARTLGVRVPPEGPVASRGGAETLPNPGPARRAPGDKYPASASCWPEIIRSQRARRAR